MSRYPKMSYQYDTFFWQLLALISIQIFMVGCTANLTCYWKSLYKKNNEHDNFFCLSQQLLIVDYFERCLVNFMHILSQREKLKYSKKLILHHKVAKNLNYIILKSKCLIWTSFFMTGYAPHKVCTLTLFA